MRKDINDKYDKSSNKQQTTILTHLSGSLVKSPLCPSLPSTVLRWRELAFSFSVSSLSLLLLMELNMVGAPSCGSTAEGTCVFWER